MKPTLQEVLTPFKLRCARCGGEAIAYPYPWPEGSVLCPACSPAWLQSFLAFASDPARIDLNPKRAWE